MTDISNSFSFSRKTTTKKLNKVEKITSWDACGLRVIVWKAQLYTMNKFAATWFTPGVYLPLFFLLSIHVYPKWYRCFLEENYFKMEKKSYAAKFKSPLHMKSLSMPLKTNLI